MDYIKLMKVFFFSLKLCLAMGEFGKKIWRKKMKKKSGRKEKIEIK